MIPDGTAVRDDGATLRRKAFVDAARAAFFRNGYAGTTMSSIAAHVGGSKTTLWNYFPSKEALFAAVVDDIVDHYGVALQVELPIDEDVTSALRRFATILMDTLMSDPILSLYQLVVGEARRFPHLAETFYDRAPRRGKERLAQWMAAKMARGELRRGDPMQAVYHFAGLCQSGVYQHAVLGLPQGRERDRLAADIEAALDAFERAWGADTAAHA